MEGGEAHALTKLSTGVDMVKWSPEGKTIAFTSSVYPDCKDDDCNSKRDAEKEKEQGESTCGGASSLPALDALE